jgi:hypothetical protein
MSDLRSNAAIAAGRTTVAVEELPETSASVSAPPALEMPDLGESPADYDQVPVVVAWMRVMREIREMRKEGRYSGGGTTYNFRGVDQAMNMFGAAVRKHGVVIMPSNVEATYRDTTTNKGNKMRECTVTVTYDIYGPKGDKIVAMSAGESLDSSDKGTAKAMSVALRVLLLQGGMVPTENRDPDADRHERGEAEMRTAESYMIEASSEQTSKQRLLTIYNELKRNNRLGEMVMPEGAEEPQTIGDYVVAIGKTR